MLLDLSDFSLLWLSCFFAIAAVIIVASGIPLVRRADQIADQTGMGEALTGGLLLGATTSLPGSVLSVSTAAFGYTELAISNAVGGIAAQTAFLTLADIAYRRANLEHAAASFTNLTQAALLIALLTIPLLAMSTPAFTIYQVSPATVALFTVYALGMRLSAKAKEEPMWQPRSTRETQDDEPEPAIEWKGWRTWLEFAGLAMIAAATGFVLAETGVELSAKSGLSETAVGAVFTAITTSLPELVTSIAAVRQGALTMAVGGIIGGNAFDVLFLAFSDIAYRGGSIYHAMTDGNVFIIVLSISMTSILLLGLLRREKHGIAGIGFESATILLLYLGAVWLVL